jgi:DNA polymerase I-like protein with 3'-5' exonuclease and polymerase domains
MLAMHRCFPDLEKSLGHCVSMFTYERFHKDEDSTAYITHGQMMDRLRYCGKDVRTMFLTHKGIEAYAKTIPGLQHSIDTANDSIVPYLVTSLRGIKYNPTDVQKMCSENDELMMQYVRCCKLLIGEKGMGDVLAIVKGKPKLFPGSNPQCAAYFHELLGYSVVARSKKTGKPSLAKYAMFKLALKYENPVIQFVLAYRHVQKEFGTLKFTPWKDDQNKIYETPKEGQLGLPMPAQKESAPSYMSILPPSIIEEL